MRGLLWGVCLLLLLVHVCLGEEGDAGTGEEYIIGLMTKIEGDEISGFQPLSLAEALGSVPGLWVQGFGYFGQRHVLGSPEGWGRRVRLKLDGQPLGPTDPFGVDLNILPVDNVERVEVGWGGTGTLQGADWTPTVLNVVTRKFTYPRPFSQVSMAWGDYGLGWTGVQFGRKLGDGLDFLLSGGLAGSDGGRQNSDYEAKRISGKSVCRIGESHSLTLSGGRYEGELGDPGRVADPTPRARRKVLYSTIGLRLIGTKDPDRGETLETFLHDLIHTYQDPDSGVNSRVRSRIYGARVAKSFILMDGHRIITGFGWRKQELFPGGWGLWDYRVFLQDRLGIKGRLMINPTLYLERYSGYDPQVLPTIRVGLRLWDRCWFFSSVEKGFYPPDLGDQYWPEQGPLRGNVHLQPEKSLEGNAGMGYRGERFGGFVDLFATDLKDPIVLVYEEQGDGSIWVPENLNRLRVWGGRIWLKADVSSQLHGVLNTTVFRDQDTSWRKPGCRVHGYLQYTDNFFKGELETSLRLVGEYALHRLNDPRSGWGSDRFLLVHLMTFLRLLDFSLYYRVDNLLDREYEWVSGYPMPGRTHRWGFRWQFWD